MLTVLCVFCWMICCYLSSSLSKLQLPLASTDRSLYPYPLHSSMKSCIWKATFVQQCYCKRIVMLPEVFNYFGFHLWNNKLCLSSGFTNRICLMIWWSSVWTGDTVTSLTCCSPDSSASVKYENGPNNLTMSSSVVNSSSFAPKFLVICKYCTYCLLLCYHVWKHFRCGTLASAYISDQLVLW